MLTVAEIFFNSYQILINGFLLVLLFSFPLLISLEIRCHREECIYFIRQVLGYFTLGELFEGLECTIWFIYNTISGINSGERIIHNHLNILLKVNIIN